MAKAERQPIPKPKGDWVTYRPDIKVLDCTIRDGGLMNDHQFSDEVVRAVYRACIEAGVDYVELGYKNSKRIFPRAENGPWKFCDEDDIRRIVGENDSPLKLAVMCDAEKSDYRTDVLPKEQSVLDVIRVATYIHQIPTALDMVKDAHDKGYETTLNLMAVSTVPDRELSEGLEAMMGSEVSAVYLVDSWGVLYSEQVRELTLKYLQYAESSGKEVGIHMHNNQQLAYANTIEGLILGASRLDASFAGLGRGAGNCPMELLLGFLHNPKFHLRPIIQCIQDHIEPMRAKLRWGFDIPYMLTGQLNQHPRAAMEFMEGEGRKDLVKFYDAVSEKE
jgi:4-hydroxy 2-oxovalerate aldolase